MKMTRSFAAAVVACSVVFSSFGVGALSPVGERLAISFPIWALYDMGPGGNFADPDRTMAELKARGFNALRFDDGAGLFATTNGVPRGKVRLHPPFGLYTPKIRQMCVVSEPCEVDVRENLVRMCRAAQKAGVKVILSSWYYLHTYWMTDEAINRELIDGLDTPAKLDYFADEHNRALRLLRENGLLSTVAFVELLNEFDGLPFTARYGTIDDAAEAERIRGWHEQAIAKMKKANPDVLFGYDVANVRIQKNLIPRNADVLNFHHYYYWSLYKTAFEHGSVRPSDGEIELPAHTASFLVEHPLAIADVVVARQANHRPGIRKSNWNAYVRTYSSLEPTRLPALEKVFAETFATNSAGYLKSLREGVASVVRIRDEVLPGAAIVMGEGGAYCPANALLAEEHCDGVWAMLREQSEILRRAGLWGTVARTPSGPEDPSWKLRADDYRQINEAFRSGVDARVDFAKETGVVRPALHSSGWSPRVHPRLISNDDAAIKALKMTYTRTHDWALVNSGQRLVDTCRVFPLMHLDPKDPKNYVFGPTDEALRLARNVGLKICYRLGESIEHTEGVHFNVLVPEDYDKYAEVMAGIVRHYNRGWANGYRWNIEYWNFWEEPDGIKNLWCLPGEEGKDPVKMRKRFIRLFVTVLKRLKAEFPEIKFGGPALCWCNLEYFRDLLESCLKEGLKPDFLSWDMYCDDPDRLVNDAMALRKLCDSLGCTKTEVILAEWHYLRSWEGVHGHNSTPAQVRAAMNGPSGLNQIDSACFTLSALSKFQFSALDQAYFYGCSHTGLWGYLNEDKSFNKPYHALVAFGSLIADCPRLYSAESLLKPMAVLAAGSSDGNRKSLLVSDYRGTSRELTLKVVGVGPTASVTVKRLDHGHEAWEEAKCRWRDGLLTLEKESSGSAAFLVTFVGATSGT